MFINDTDLFTRFVDTFFLFFIDGRLPYKLMQRKISRSNTAVFSGKKKGGVFLLKLY